MKFKVTIVSSAQPSANPRAVKEAITLAENNYLVTFIYCPLSPWADEYDDILFAENKSIKWICAGFHQHRNKWGYLFARVRKKIWEKLSPFLKNKFDASSKAIILFFQELKKEAKKNKADFYIAHNLGAIGAANYAAKFYNTKVAFDAEDFHRGEFIHKSLTSRNVENIELKYFPLMNYISVASPLIGDAYNNIFPTIEFHTIKNVFPLIYLKKLKPENKNDELNLFWFSQFIGPNRGIEDFIYAINECVDIKVKLNIMGNISDAYKKEITQLINTKEKLDFIKTGSPRDTFFYAQKFDVGIASETGFSVNNNIALSNKLFTYLLSANIVLLSNTQAQSKFYNDNKGIGFLYNSGDVSQIGKILKELYVNTILLKQLKNNSLELAKNKYNWDLESKLFLKLVSNVLKNQ